MIEVTADGVRPRAAWISSTSLPSISMCATCICRCVSRISFIFFSNFGCPIRLFCCPAPNKSMKNLLVGLPLRLSQNLIFRKSGHIPGHFPRHCQMVLAVDSYTSGAFGMGFLYNNIYLSRYIYYMSCFMSCLGYIITYCLFNPITLIPLYTVVRLRDVDSGTVPNPGPKPLAIWILLC